MADGDREGARAVGITVRTIVKSEGKEASRENAAEGKCSSGSLGRNADVIYFFRVEERIDFHIARGSRYYCFYRRRDCYYQGQTN